MELDELKDIWKKKDADFRPKPEAEIALMLKGSSRSVVDKLIRSVWFELIFTAVSGTALLIYALTLPSGALKWTSVSILAVFVGYSFYYIKKLSVLKRFSRVENNIKENLVSLIETLGNYLKFYKRSYTILYPAYFCLALLFGGIERGLDEFLLALTNWKTISYLVLIAGLFYVCSTWVVDWFLRKLYGNHLDKLQSLLNDLNSVDRAEV
jgi:hypothetical protein